MSAEAVDPSVAPSLVDDMALRLQRHVGLVPARGLGVVRRAVFFALLTSTRDGLPRDVPEGIRAQPAYEWMLS
jgi:hypothetical protein